MWSSDVRDDFYVLPNAPSEYTVFPCLFLGLFSCVRVGFVVVAGLVFAEYVSGDDFGVVSEHAGCECDAGGEFADFVVVAHCGVLVEAFLDGHVRGVGVEVEPVVVVGVFLECDLDEEDGLVLFCLLVVSFF